MQHVVVLQPSAIQVASVQANTRGRCGSALLIESLRCRTSVLSRVDAPVIRPVVDLDGRRPAVVRQHVLQLVRDVVRKELRATAESSSLSARGTQLHSWSLDDAPAVTIGIHCIRGTAWRHRQLWSSCQAKPNLAGLSGASEGRPVSQRHSITTRMSCPTLAVESAGVSVPRHDVWSKGLPGNEADVPGAARAA